MVRIYGQSPLEVYAAYVGRAVTIERLNYDVAPIGKIYLPSCSEVSLWQIDVNVSDQSIGIHSEAFHIHTILKIYLVPSNVRNSLAMRYNRVIKRRSLRGELHEAYREEIIRLWISV